MDEVITDAEGFWRIYNELEEDCENCEDNVEKEESSEEENTDNEETEDIEFIDTNTVSKIKSWEEEISTETAFDNSVTIDPSDKIDESKDRRKKITRKCRKRKMDDSGVDKLDEAGAVNISGKAQNNRNAELPEEVVYPDKELFFGKDFHEWRIFKSSSARTQK